MRIVWANEQTLFEGNGIMQSLLPKGQTMKIKLATICFVMGALLAPVAGYTADSDMDRSHPKAFVKDSAITTQIKVKLGAENLASTTHVKVDTDSNGVVWLSGTAKTKDEENRAVSIANNTEGVSSVRNSIKVRKHH